MQSGDTGNFVTSAEGWFVAHAPGYPLLIGLEAVFLRIFPLGSVFFRAAFLNLLFSLGALFFLWKTSRDQRVFGPLVVGLLAFSHLYWRYSELPEVFTLQSLFATALLYFYFSERPDRFRWVCFLFFLSFAHHHTTIFLFPVIIDVIVSCPRRRSLLLPSLVGAGLAGLFYLLLLTMHPEDLRSFGDASSLGGVLHLILRSDYGTFQLGSDVRDSFAQSYGRVFKTTLENFWALLAAFVLTWSFSRRVRELWGHREEVLLWTLGLYVVIFFGLARMPLESGGTIMLDRFQILAEVMLCCLAVRLVPEISGRWRWLAPALVAMGTLVSVIRFFPINNFADNTVVEDYCINFLSNVLHDKNTIVLPYGDTPFYGSLYVQSVKGVRPDLTILGPRMINTEWYHKKYAPLGLQFTISPEHPLDEARMSQDFIAKNISHFSFATNLYFATPGGVHTVILPLGRFLDAGEGLSLLADSQVSLLQRSRPRQLSFEAGSGYDEDLDLWSQYCKFEEVKGDFLLSQGMKEAALRQFSTAAAENPTCEQADVYACHLRNELKASTENCALKMQARREKERSSR